MTRYPNYLLSYHALRIAEFASFLNVCTSHSGTAPYHFFGDSITEAGVNPDGYVTLVTDSLKIFLPDAIVMGAGVSGNKVPDLLTRLEQDVLTHQPTHVVIYIGVNDVWHHFEFEYITGTDPDTFENGLTTLVDRIEARGSSVMLCTPSVIGEDLQSNTEVNLHLEKYSQITRSVAQEKDVHLCDLREHFEDYLTQNNKEKAYSGILTVDGVHLNTAGNQFVADILFKELRAALGF